MGKKYVAYVGTYTHGTSKGIQVYDVNLEEGTLTERSEVEVSNASFPLRSYFLHHSFFLYLSFHKI